ncbi:DUF4255 domain-containing protein [Streptomyces sp. NBC_00237]|uniref:DUF4255 domain-containing protein n=1 Tax=Streptomyces sp. NBC_00237 TaxID=2975687 RepID=UPI0022552C0C|nr:DUF4255 domain-containing protein [Streptomyces sp. NBC_00237]MCX5205383.1 DUF4255 domain-containing protein [Streptomyces sp. NBC_00237]
MSNALAVATVTSTLAHVLDEALAAPDAGNVPGVHTTTVRPDLPGPSARGVNVFLYQVTPNAAWAGDALPARRSDGTALLPPQQALDLHYLLTFYGDETALEPQRLLGTVVRTLSARPVLTRQVVRRAVQHAVTLDPASYLKFADLDEQVDVVRFTMLPLNLEELSRLWSTFFQVSYRLTVAYRASVVLLTGSVDARTALPVRARRVDVAPFGALRISRVGADSGPDDPVTAGTTLRVEGARLRGERVTRIRMSGSMSGSRSGIEADVPADQVTDDRLTIALPGGVRAGLRGLQVLHPRLVGDPPEERGSVESNVAPVLVRPAIGPGGVTTAPGAGGTTVLTVPLDPPVGRRQRVALLLDGLGAQAGRAHTFVVPSRPGPQEEDSSVQVVAKGVASGDYLVRVQVDGAESVLGVDAGGVYDRPRVTLP